MSQNTERLDMLRKINKEWRSIPQTVEREFEKARLDMEIAVLEGELRSRIARRVILLLDAWKKSGRFTVINEDGMRMESDPVVTGNAIQDFWNVRGEAHKLANWSFGVKSPYL